MKQKIISFILSLFTSLPITQGGLLNFSADIMDCDVTFTWTGAPKNMFDVSITIDQMPRSNYLYTTNTHYTIEDGLFYNCIKVEVRVYLEVRSQKPYYDKTLIYKVRPLKPKINGNLGVMVGSYANVTCSLPVCYTRQNPISYSWFVNDTKMDKEIGDTLRVPVTKDQKHNQYSCTAKGNRGSSSSDRVQINPLYEDFYVFYTAQPRSESNTLILNKDIIFLVAIIVSVILVTTVAAAMVLYFLKRKKKKNSVKSVQVDEVEVENDTPTEHPTSELYAAVDKTLLKKRNDTDDVLLKTKDSEVQNEEACLLTTTTVSAADILKHDVQEEVEGSENPTAVTCENSASSHLKQDGLIYIDVEFVNKTENPDTCTLSQIHGDEDKTEYTFVDFSQSAQLEHDKPETRKGK